MKNSTTRWLMATPLVISAIATGTFAEDALAQNPTSPIIENLAVVASQPETVVPLRVTIPADGTYVFTSPAQSAITISLNGTAILTVPRNADENAQPFRVITNLTAGDHLIELEGLEFTREQSALISMSALGSDPVSIANAAVTLSPEEAEALAAIVSNRTTHTSTPMQESLQVAAPNAARQPFMIGSGSVGRSQAAQENIFAAVSAATTRPSHMRSTNTVPAPASMAPATGGKTSGGGIFRRTVDGAIETAKGGGSSGDSAGTPGTPAPPAGTPAPPTGTPVPPTGTPAPPTDTPAPPTDTPVPPTDTPAPPTDTPVPPVVVPTEMAQTSALTPPTGVTLTQAVQIIGGASDAGVVANTGQTLFGQVMDPMTFDMVNVTLSPSDRSFTVDVGPTTGQFAVRLFPEDLRLGETTVTVTGASSSDSAVTSVPIAYEFGSAMAADGVTQALSRMTNGPTADLYARVRAIGFENYVNEQLNPDAINDSAFEAMGFDDMLVRTNEIHAQIVLRLYRHNLAHSAFSEKQLQDVMGDFWNNHFHAATKDSVMAVQNIDDRQFFRENAFGRFEDLLLYSARSPLMSQFLDNDQSRAGRLNENYGREVLELHTVGVDGGYGDDDVIAVSRVFTGWNYRRTNPDAQDQSPTYEFEFQQDNHDTADKVIPFMDTTIAGRAGAAGVEEGEELIGLLAADPRTQNFVCGKIVQRFVADVPPADFVQICVAAWQASDGDSGEILRAILTAPDYITNVALQRNKVKTPYEYAVSTIRALGMVPDADDVNGGFFERFRATAHAAGHTPHFFPAPSGLPEVGAAWTNSATMVAKFSGLTFIVERTSVYNHDLEADVRDAGLETAEEVAAYLLTIATADHFTLEEYESLVGVLKGVDGIFEPRTQDETTAFDRAAGLLIVLPSFEMQ